MRYALCIQYNGSPFNGWQIQKAGQTVQGVLQAALFKFMRAEVKVVGCGRTDTGVHACNYMAHFDFEGDLDCASARFKLNNILPGAISVSDLRPSDPEFHARFSAVSRSYKYFIALEQDAYLHPFAVYIKDELNVEAMNQAGMRLLKYRDFASFCKSGGGNQTNICRVVKAQWIKRDHLLVFEITADRFLRNMVRAVAGTMMELGRGKITLDDFEQIVEAKDRTAAGFSAPAHGLHLWNIEYPEALLPNIEKRNNLLLNG